MSSSSIDVSKIGEKEVAEATEKMENASLVAASSEEVRKFMFLFCRF
jgi:hypothetical protein